MPENKPARKPSVRKTVVKKRVERATKKKPVATKPVKISLPARLAAIQYRYRRALLDAADRPDREQGEHIRAALAALLAEKAALGVRDGEEAAAVLE